MKNSVRIGAAASALALAAATVCTAATAPAPAHVTLQPRHAAVVNPNNFQNPDPARFLFENKITPGMTGYGLTVMHGDKIQKFHVTVIDVISNFQPEMNAILVRCSGLGLKHSGIIEGMSGSPVFIHGKLIGAIAFGWARSKDPISGVQPIRQMLRIPMPRHKPTLADARGGGSDFRWRAGGHNIWRACALSRPGWANLARQFGGVGGGSSATSGFGSHTLAVPAGGPRMEPLASPLMLSNASPTVVKFLTQAFAGRGLTPLAAGAAGSATPLLGGMKALKPGDLKLVPGAAIAVPLMTGDMDACAIGTVTAVVGKHVYAFGHNFFAQGRINLPIATSYIYTILPDLKSSFKIGTTYHVKGALLTDEMTGIVGGLGLKPLRVPVEIEVRNHTGTLNRNFHYTLYPSPHTTPEMLTAALAASLTAQRKLPHNYTVHLSGKIAFGHTVLRLDQRDDTGNFDPKATMLPVAMLTDNPFQDRHLKSIKIKVNVDSADHGAQITNVSLRRSHVAPGDMLKAFVTLKPYDGKSRSVEMKVRIPVNTADGQYQLFIGSATQALGEDAMLFPDRFSPHNGHELLAAVRRILGYKNNRLYLRLLLAPHGTASSSVELPNLPMTRVAMVAANASSDTVPLFNSVAKSVPAHAVIEGGGQNFTITVARHADNRFVPKHPGMPGFPGGFPGFGGS